MALDFSMISDRGEILGWIPIPVNIHGQLFDLIDRSRYPQLGRIHDYYEDVMYNLSDLDQLILDLRGFHFECEEVGRRHFGLVEEMLDFVELARSEARRIEVVAD